MTVFRCKMCGGDLEVSEGAAICTCRFCGRTQTIPKINDEGLKKLFNRANVLRMRSEFDKAAEVYERIIRDTNTESEAYWGLILCKYGIEYVEDPVSFKRIPTCHRTSYDAVVSDEDYRNAIQFADSVQKGIYEEQAREIDTIQKGIIEVAQREEPYDVFICYKEEDESGRRTQDSVIANDIYYQLIREGFKVFYAAITLEDKLGTEYEPYIFSALNTAKVMLVLGTTPAYFRSAWVKNEWCRFLSIMKEDHGRILIPCYRDMDPLELPAEFSRLQSQDMGKIGFINDIVRGIKKIIGEQSDRSEIQKRKVVQKGSGKQDTILNVKIKRGNMALEDQAWSEANRLFELALDIDPEYAPAHMGRLLAKNQSSTFDVWLAMQKEKYVKASTVCLEAFPKDSDYINMLSEKYAIKGYLEQNTISREVDYHFDRTYVSSLSCRKKQKEEQLAELAADRFLNYARKYSEGEDLKQIQDGLAAITAVLDLRIEQAENQDMINIAHLKTSYAVYLARAEQKVAKMYNDAQKHREQDYESALTLMKNENDITSYENAEHILKVMDGYRNSHNLCIRCQDEIKRCQEKKKWKTDKRIVFMVTIIFVACIIGQIIMTYEENSKSYNETSYKEDNVDDVEWKEDLYADAVELKDSGNYEDAISAFKELDGYKDADDQIEQCTECLYEYAVELKDSGNYEDAISIFKELDGYKDSAELQESIRESEKIIELCNAETGDIVSWGSYEQDCNTDNGKEDIEWIVLEKEEDCMLVVSKYALDCQPYMTTSKDTTWQECKIRRWLNDIFTDNAFSSGQQNRIMSQVFLLSLDEVQEYFVSDSDRQCLATSYVKSQDKYNSSAEYCSWWLRSSRGSNNYAPYVDTNGVVKSDGDVVDSYYCVRPALWIDFGEVE